jgi:hypothetical protein
MQYFIGRILPLDNQTAITQLIFIKANCENMRSAVEEFGSNSTTSTNPNQFENICSPFKTMTNLTSINFR